MKKFVLDNHDISSQEAIQLAGPSHGLLRAHLVKLAGELLGIKKS